MDFQYYIYIPSGLHSERAIERTSRVWIVIKLLTSIYGFDLVAQRGMQYKEHHSRVSCVDLRPTQQRLHL